MNSMLMDLVEKLTGALGYSILPMYLEHQLYFIKYLRKLFKKYEVDLVLDVGANKGQYYDLLRKWVRYKGPIISFEPIPKNVEILEGRSRLDGHWAIRSLGLGSKKERKKFL